jgi:hypothetical protein
MNKIALPPGVNPLKMEPCDVCGKKFSVNNLVVLPNELAQEGINRTDTNCFILATREFYAPMRDILMRMKEEQSWK